MICLITSVVISANRFVLLYKIDMYRSANIVQYSLNMAVQC